MVKSKARYAGMPLRAVVSTATWSVVAQVGGGNHRANQQQNLPAAEALAPARTRVRRPDVRVVPMVGMGMPHDLSPNEGIDMMASIFKPS